MCVTYVNVERNMLLEWWNADLIMHTFPSKSEQNFNKAVGAWRLGLFRNNVEGQIVFHTAVVGLYG